MRKIILTAVCIAFVLSSTLIVLAQDQQTTEDTDKQVIKVIQDFWIALGDSNVEALKQTFDWPVSVVETSATGTKNPRVLMTPKDLDADFKEQRPKPGHSEFYGAKLTDFKVQMQSPTLALVTYTATIPANGAHKETQFTAIAIVRNDPLWKAWKIVFITVPK